MKMLARLPGSQAHADADVVLDVFQQRTGPMTLGWGGHRLLATLRQHGVLTTPRSLDLLSIALAVNLADQGASREGSPDGWTRELDLEIEVRDSAFWQSQALSLAEMLRFLTTDHWTVTFRASPWAPSPFPVRTPLETSAALLSGGLDSLIGGIDLLAQGQQPILVSSLAQGDGMRQRRLGHALGARHIQFRHTSRWSTNARDRSQRARSFLFFAYGVAVATWIAQTQHRTETTLYVCENGFISVNPALTGARVGSLSTRTTHPNYMRAFQRLLESAELPVKLVNPYAFSTKGEMVAACRDRVMLEELASDTNSCGRYARNAYRHCGRCVPCLVRRAAFVAAAVPDPTPGYVYDDLSIEDNRHALFDDVRSVGMAFLSAEVDASWARAATTDLGLDRERYFDTVNRGMRELGQLLRRFGLL